MKQKKTFLIQKRISFSRQFTNSWVRALPKGYGICRSGRTGSRVLRWSNQCSHRVAEDVRLDIAGSRSRGSRRRGRGVDEGVPGSRRARRYLRLCTHEWRGRLPWSGAGHQPEGTFSSERSPSLQTSSTAWNKILRYAVMFCRNCTS